ncbi:Fumarate hydratase class I [Diplonema papillatum]|nr:Fumarate hydratase class I [Diplonema papillatum]|eukprot:gene13644-20991_t
MLRNVGRGVQQRWASAVRNKPFVHQDVFATASPDPTEYTYIEGSKDWVKVTKLGDREFLEVAPEALTRLSERAMDDVGHLLRSSHLEQLADIIRDKEATSNDRFVAMELLKNAVIAADRVLPSCQDTGTAIVMGKRGENVLVDGDDAELLSLGVYNTYTKKNLRYSQVSPMDMFKEVNTGTNLPAQIDLYATKGSKYSFLFMAKGGGSANKTFLYQRTKALLNPKALRRFLDDNIRTLGTAACPPYHLALVIGGLSAEMNLKAVKLASARYLDNLPTQGNEFGGGYRDVEWENEILQMTRDLGMGAQFGGKYFCHDVRVIRLPRHGASCPVGLGVSCSADRQMKAYIDKDGVFVETLETDPSKHLPDVTDLMDAGGNVVHIDLNLPMDEIRKVLTKLEVSTRLSLTGTLIVARDIAHAKILERHQSGEGIPSYFKDHMIYYAGPAKTPEGLPSGSFGPTTAARMDPYLDTFMSEGASMVSLAKGNRSKSVTQACKKHGGFYLGSVGGPAAILAKNCIRKVEVLDMPELGMEAVWKIEVEDFPAFVIVDDKGNDFFNKYFTS